VHVAALILSVNIGLQSILLLALFDIHRILEVPSLDFVGPFDIVAGVTAFSLLSGSVTAPTGIGVVIILVIVLNKCIIFGHQILESVQFILQMILVDEGASLFQLAFVSDKLNMAVLLVDLNAVFPDVMALIQVQ